MHKIITGKIAELQGSLDFPQFCYYFLYKFEFGNSEKRTGLRNIPDFRLLDLGSHTVFSKFKNSHLKIQNIKIHIGIKTFKTGSVLASLVV